MPWEADRQSSWSPKQEAGKLTKKGQKRERTGAPPTLRAVHCPTTVESGSIDLGANSIFQSSMASGQSGSSWPPFLDVHFCSGLQGLFSECSAAESSITFPGCIRASGDKQLPLIRTPEYKVWKNQREALNGPMCVKCVVF